MQGYINSFESFGTKDGPGIRFVVFMQGCPLRCLYCHNVDTWELKDKNYIYTPNEILAELNKVKAFLTGGITASGGEPLMQASFILELFKLCKENGIHTALDTSGYIFNDQAKKVLEYTDLVLLDIKHIDKDMYKKITSVDLEPTLKFIQYLQEINKPVWLRYVLLPGYTDEKESVTNLKKDFKSKDLFKDELVVIGRRRIENISQVVNSTIAMPNYKTNIGKTGLDILAKLDNFSEISKKIEYKDDAISSLESVDLYEVDYAFITRKSLAYAKNSEICYRFPATMEGNKILYRIYLDMNSSDNSKNFYNFLEEEFTEKIQEKPKSEKNKAIITKDVEGKS